MSTVGNLTLKLPLLDDEAEAGAELSVTCIRGSIDATSNSSASHSLLPWEEGATAFYINLLVHDDKALASHPFSRG